MNYPKKNIKNQPVGFNPLNYPFSQYPVAFLDYIWVITMYVTASFSLALLIDGHLLPSYDEKKESAESSFILGSRVLLQLAIQGFIAIVLSALLQSLPSPVNNIFGYNSHTSLGLLLRNPSIISVILFSLSDSLRSRMVLLHSRLLNKKTTQ